MVTIVYCWKYCCFLYIVLVSSICKIPTVDATYEVEDVLFLIKDFLTLMGDEFRQIYFLCLSRGSYDFFIKYINVVNYVDFQMSNQPFLPELNPAWP